MHWIKNRHRSLKQHLGLRVLGCILLAAPVMGMAAPADVSRLDPAPIVNVWRDWRSPDGQFFLTVRTGVWDPNGTLFFLNKRGGRSVEGFQKGSSIALKSFNPELGLAATPEYMLSGTLDSRRNTFAATFTDVSKNAKLAILFTPAIPIPDRPLLTFRFYGVPQDDWPQHRITRVDVVDQQSHRIIQQLDGFTAQGYMVDYVDINYDGYFDLVMHIGKNVADQHYVYWLYDPHSRHFKRDATFESMTGHPTRYPQKQQVHFQNGLYHIQNHQWQAIPCCYADD